MLAGLAGKVKRAQANDMSGGGAGATPGGYISAGTGSQDEMQAQGLCRIEVVTVTWSSSSWRWPRKAAPASSAAVAAGSPPMGHGSPWLEPAACLEVRGIERKPPGDTQGFLGRDAPGIFGRQRMRGFKLLADQIGAGPPRLCFVESAHSWQPGQ